MFEITSDFVWQAIQPRPRDAHKGTFGSVLAVAGSASYRGAAALAVGRCPAHRSRYRYAGKCGTGAGGCGRPPARVLSLPLRSGGRGRDLAPKY